VKKRVTYEILVHRDPEGTAWDTVDRFSTSKGDIEAERLAHRAMRKLEPMTVNATSALFRIVIVPEGLAGQPKDWAV